MPAINVKIERYADTPMNPSMIPFGTRFQSGDIDAIVIGENSNHVHCVGKNGEYFGVSKMPTNEAYKVLRAQAGVS